MGEITTFPGRHRRQRTISAAEMYDAPEPSDEMVWNVCPHLRFERATDSADTRCLGCPAQEFDEMAARYSDDGKGMVKRMCRGLAEEVCRIVLAQQIKDGAHA